MTNVDTRMARDNNSRTIQEAPALQKKFYSDATFDYVCRAAPGVALTTASWQVLRIRADGTKEFADGDSFFDNVATSLAVVAALTFTDLS